MRRARRAPSGRRTAATWPAVVAIAAAIPAGALAGCGGDSPPRAGTVTVEIGPGARAGDRGAGGAGGAARRPPDVPGAKTCPGAGRPATEGAVAEAERAIRCLTDAVREREGLEPLAPDAELAEAAARRSRDMVEQDYFAHVGPDGGDVRRAARQAGWVPEGRSWLLGENIAWAPEDAATPADVMRSWLDSPAHRANILNEAFTQIGVGAVAELPVPRAEPGTGATITQVFGVTGDAARRAQTR